MPARIATVPLRLLAALALVVCASLAASTFAAPPVDLAPREGGAVPVWSAPTIDAARLEREDRVAAEEPRRPFRVGQAVPVGVTPADAGRWSVDGQGMRWQLELRSGDARWVGLTLDGIDLPRGAAIVARDAGGAPIAQLDGPAALGQWRTPPARGGAIELELTLAPGLDARRVSMRIGELTHGYRGVFARDDTESTRAAAGGGAGPCNVDVSCPLGDTLADQARGIVKLLIDAPGVGTFLCSGTLINTTANDCRPYVLTANHCYGNGGGAPTTTFIFGFELPACGGGSSDESRFIVGATELARWVESDARLMELPVAPLDEWEPFYNGWNRSALSATNAWIVHHPSGDVKKISRDAGPVTNGVVEADHWRVNNWEDGTTEGGSSGAPLFDQNLRVIGQLDFGTAGCGFPAGWDEFGKFSVSWADGPTPSDRLEDWLDPIGSGAVVLDGLDQTSCSAGTLPTLSGAVSVDDRLGNEDGRLHPGEIADIDVDLANLGIDAANNVTATLSSSDGRVGIRQPDTSWPDLPPLSDGIAANGPAIEIELGPTFPCGDNVPLTLTIDADEGSWEESILLPSGTTSATGDSFADDVEGGIGGWSETTLLPGRFNPWSQTTSDSNSPSTSWFVPDLSARHDTVLVMPTQDPLPPGSTLRFWHRMGSENGFDGGVLELSTDGASWFDAGPWFVDGGYNGGISEGFGSTLAGRDAWTGSFAWQPVEVDLSSFAGGELTARWRFALDTFGGGDGWYVDDVAVESETRACPSPWVNIVPGARCTGAVEPRDPSRAGSCSPTKPRLRVRP